MRFGSLRSLEFVGLTLLASNTDLIDAVLEASLPLLKAPLPGFLSLVDLGGEFLGLLNFLVDHS